jgi:hypothetical protein
MAPAFCSGLVCGQHIYTLVLDPRTGTFFTVPALRVPPAEPEEGSAFHTGNTLGVANPHVADAQ